MNWLGKAIAFILMLLSVSALNGQTTANTPQQKAITMKEFAEIDKKAKQLLKTTPYRLTITSEPPRTEKDEVFEISKLVEERVPPDRSRRLLEGTEQKKPWKNEMIVIGNLQFVRENDGPWAKPGKNKLGTHYPESFVAMRYFAHAPTLVDGKQINVFVIIQDIKIEFSSFTEERCIAKQVRSYDSDGRLIKILIEYLCGKNRKFLTNKFHSSEKRKQKKNISR